MNGFTLLICMGSLYPVLHGTQAQVRYLDESCSDNSQCSVTNGECSSSTCSCQSGYFQLGSGSTGTCTKRYLGQSCNTDSECSLVAFGECRSYCVCQSGYFTDGSGMSGKCSKRSLGESCTDTSQCEAQNAQCTGSGIKTCSCQAGYLQVNNNCLKRSLGQTCTDTSQCSTQNVQCSGSGAKTCSCQAGYYQESNSCLKRSLGETCGTDSHCSIVSNSECSSSTCSCKSDYFQSGNTCTKRSLGQTCFANSHCIVTNSECSSGTCSCKSDYYQSGSTCTKRSLGQTCSADSHCSIVSNSECSSFTCSCKSDYFQSVNTCTKRFLGQSCSADSHCSIVDNSECKNSRCSCKSGFYNDGSTCTKRRLGESCSSTSQCSATNAVCSSGSSRKCQCPSTYYDTNGSGTGGSCTLKVGLGGTCPQPTTAVPNTATCSDTYATRCTGSSGSYTCQCISTYYDNMGTADRKCVLKVGLGYNCPRSNACGTTYAGCVGVKCVCNSQYYDDNGATTLGGNCLGRKSLGAVCTGSPIRNYEQCSDSGATCTLVSGSYRCTCNTGYHQEGSVCVANKPLGETCSVSTDCSDPASGCLGDKCTCNLSHYDGNGLTNGGTCKPMTNLQVTNIDFPSSSIKTSEITVTWSAPVSYKQFIDRYSVEWKRTYDNSINVESQSVYSSVTSLELTRGIQAGRAYTVTIISINDQTQQTSERVTSVSKQQAAKPGVTSGLDWSNSDRDASSGTIKIAWYSAPAYVSQYSVQLLDGTTVIKTSTIQSPQTQAEFGSTGLKDGYRYNVTIVARSESYDSGKRVSGETFTGEFKTEPQIPDPPQNGICKDPTDRSITLTWSQPADTRGDLVQYHIRVFQYSGILKFKVSTAGTGTQLTIGDLDSGTFYTFRIYTENEKYNSSRYDIVSTGCKTKAKMSEPPTNLEITGVTSRSFDISWNKPSETYSEENYGYVLQIKDETGSCRKEIIYRCSDCDGSFQISSLDGLCSSAVRTEMVKTTQDLESQMSFSASLDPDIAYTVTVTAINDAGRGYLANMTERTLEEAPQSPYNVIVSDIGITSLKVSWSIDGPRPGKTNFTITLSADAPAATKEFTLSECFLEAIPKCEIHQFWFSNLILLIKISIRITGIHLLIILYICIQLCL